MVSIDVGLCIGCGACMTVCPASAISLDEYNSMCTIDNEKCIKCLACIGTCPIGAISEKDNSELQEDNL